MAVVNGVRLSGALFQTISRSPVLGMRVMVAGATGATKPKDSEALHVTPPSFEVLLYTEPICVRIIIITDPSRSSTNPGSIAPRLGRSISDCDFFQLFPRSSE